MDTICDIKLTTRKAKRRFRLSIMVEKGTWVDLSAGSRENDQLLGKSKRDPSQGSEEDDDRLVGKVETR